MPEGGQEQPHYPFKSHKEYLGQQSNLSWASVFWRWLEEPEIWLNSREARKKKDAPLPSPTFPPSDPKKLIESFNQYKHDLQNHKKYLADHEELAYERLGLARMEDIDELSLYDVYLYGVRTIHEKLTQPWVLNPPKRADLPERVVTQVARHEQTLALVEEAMKLADHQPKDTPLPTVS